MVRIEKTTFMSLLSFVVLTLLLVSFTYAAGVAGARVYGSCDAPKSVLREKCTEPLIGRPDAALPVPLDPYGDACENRSSLSCADAGPFVNFTHDRQTTLYNADLGDIISFTVNLTGLNNTPEGAAPADISFVLDISGSMAGQKMVTATKALNLIHSYFYKYDVNHSTDYFKMGLSMFNHDGNIVSRLKRANPDVFPNLPACGCTSVGGGIIDGLADLTNGGLSCQNGDVKRSLILASDGIENVDPMISAAKSLDPGYVTYYTIGVESPAGWSKKLSEIANTWGTAEGSYYGAASVNDLYDIFLQISQNFISDKPASTLVVGIQLTDDFEFAGSSLEPIFVDRNYIEWNIDSIDKDELKSFEVHVIPIGDSGIVDVVDTANSFVKITNKCSVESIPFQSVRANIASLDSCSTDNLVSYYRFDVDHGSVAHDYTDGNKGNITDTERASGIIGNALNFSGYGNAAVGDAANLDLNEFTLSAWINPRNDWRFACIPGERCTSACNELVSGYPGGDWKTEPDKGGFNCHDSTVEDLYVYSDEACDILGVAGSNEEGCAEYYGGGDAQYICPSYDRIGGTVTDADCLCVGDFNGWSYPYEDCVSNGINPSDYFDLSHPFFSGDTAPPLIILGKGTDAYELRVDNLYELTVFSSGEAVSATASQGWHHVALTYDNTNVTLYLDNVKKATKEVSSPSTNSNPLLLGEHYAGMLDEVSIWNVSLAPNKISELYNEGAGRYICEEIVPVCGNAIQEEGEECDDGNLNWEDGCSATCTYNTCSADGLLAYWRLDEKDTTTAFDSTGNGYTATVQQSARIDGIANGAGAVLVGAGNISRNDVDLGYAGSNAMTYVLWFSINSTSSNGNIIGDSSPVTDGWVLHHDDAADTITLTIYDEGVPFDIGQVTITEDVWYQVAIFINQTSVGLYVNSTLQAANTIDILTEGNIVAGLEDAKIDEISIWNRKLTQAELSNLYNAGDGYPACGAPLSGYRCEIKEVECEIDDAWQECSEISYGDTLSALRARTRDPDNDVQNVSFVLQNLHDRSHTAGGWIVPKGYATTQNDTSGIWKYELAQPVTIHDSGAFVLDIQCHDLGQWRCDYPLPTDNDEWIIPLAEYFIDRDGDFLPEAYCNAIDDIQNISINQSQLFTDSLACQIRTGDCMADETGIMKLSDTTSGTAGLYETSAHGYSVCCSGPVDTYVSAGQCSETGIISLSADDAATAAAYDALSSYDTHICLVGTHPSEEANCTVRNSCIGDEVCLFAFDNGTGSVSACTGGYSEKVCCVIS
jgi:cysteine-rich repeat protein